MNISSLVRRASFFSVLLFTLSAQRANAESAPPPRHVEVAELKRAPPIRIAPLSAAQVNARYGGTLKETIKRFPDFKQAIVSLSPTFFDRESEADASKAGRLEDGREVLLLPGCLNMFLCDSTRYVIAADVAHKTVAFIEHGGAAHAYLLFGKPDLPLQNVLFGAAVAVLEPHSAALARQLAESAKLSGITMLPQAPIDRSYGDLSNGFATYPELGAALRRVYPASSSLLGADTVCGARLRDGRELLLATTTTSNAEGAVGHAYAYDAHHKQAYVYRSEGQLGAAAFFGNPDATLQAVLSTMDNCSNLRARLGLDPNGAPTTAAAAPAAPPAHLDFSNAGIDDPTLPVRFLATLQSAVAAGEKGKVASLIAYPIVLVDHGKRLNIASPTAFLQKYDLAMNQKVRSALAAQRPEQLFSNWQGVMVGSGEIWFGGRPDGRTLKIVAINN